MGGIGQLDYCAANLFLDYFVSKQFKQCKQILTINWNSWSSIGMATQLERSKTHEALYLENSISPQEAILLLESALQSEQQQVIISRNDPSLEREGIIAAFDNAKTRKLTPSEVTKPPKKGQLKTIQSHQYQRIKTRLSWLRSYSPSTVNLDVILLATKDLLPFYKQIKAKENNWTA